VNLRVSAISKIVTAAGKIRHEQLFFLEDGRPISDPEITRWSLEREHQGAQYSKARTLSCAAFLGDLAAHVGKESAVGREAARA